MGASKKLNKQNSSAPGSDFIESLGEENWQYVKTIINILREPILILDKDERIVISNEPFYHAFQLDPKETEGRVLYELGHGQWNIPSLRKLLEEVVPKNGFFKGYELAYEFPFIGRKVMIVNAREIHCKKVSKVKMNSQKKPCAPLVMLAMEDITDMMVVAERLADHAKQVNYKFNLQTRKLEDYIGRLEKEVNILKGKS